MKIDELIKLLQKKKEEHWDWDIIIMQEITMIHGTETVEFDIESIKHNWEDWLAIYIYMTKDVYD
jgi:hypothetical protein